MMGDLQTVCCLCGDIGFPDKLFRCNKCHHRFQHSYCSNYYGELAEIELCDWCQRDEKNVRHDGSHNQRRSTVAAVVGNDLVGSATSRSEYSSEKIKQQHDHEEHGGGGGGGSSRGKTAAGTGAPSPRQSTRRYKLLKDVMC